MLSRQSDAAESFKKNRRSEKERRSSSDRRNLIRFEDLGNERRAGMQRRTEEFYREMGVYPEID